MGGAVTYQLAVRSGKLLAFEQHNVPSRGAYGDTPSAPLLSWMRVSTQSRSR